MEENKNLLLKGAMTYGLAMGIYWVVKYIFFIFSVSVPSLSLVYWLLTLAVPFIVSLEYFVFYQFIAPPDFVANAIGQLTTVLKDSQVSSEMIDSLSKIRISPIHMAIQGIFNNVFYGIILSIPVAALLCRNNSTGSITENR